MLGRARKLFGLAVLEISLVAAGEMRAAAQVRSGAWEIDFHVGGISEGSAPSGTAIASFPVGDPIATPNGVTSRAVSSWYFGDGAELLNSVNRQHSTPQMVATLDPTLRSAAAGSSGGVTFGVRVSRRFKPRLSAEFAIDFGATPVDFTDEAREAIDAAATSFISAWDGFLDDSSATNRDVTADATVTDSTGGQTFVTGLVRYDLRADTRLTPYVTAGVGGVFGRGDAPAAALTGRYQFNFGPAPYSETDRVAIHVVPDDSGFATVFGGGVDYAVSRNRALRVDVRVVVASVSSAVFIDAEPEAAINSPAAAISTFTNPSIQFANSPFTPRRTSLSGPPIAGLETFSASSTSVRLNLSVGYVFRF
jgi:opacity protein-like surface antigen